MNRLRILSTRGSALVEWHAAQADAGEPAALDAVREARQIFDAAIGLGSAAFQVEPGRQPQPIEIFEPSATEVVLLPRVAGGAISHDGRTVMTRAGMARLEKELDRLRVTERAEMAGRLRQARENPGDQSDNLELLEAHQELALLEGRIADLEYTLAQAQVVDAQHTDEAQVGSVVLVHDDEGEAEYTLVGPAEADPRQGLISIASPVGRALLGSRAGDETVVETPIGERTLRVLKVA